MQVGSTLSGYHHDYSILEHGPTWYEIKARDRRTGRATYYGIYGTALAADQAIGRMETLIRPSILNK